MEGPHGPSSDTALVGTIRAYNVLFVGTVTAFKHILKKINY